MKLAYFDNFAFAIEGKNGAFAVNPAGKDDKLMFSIFTVKDRDIDLKGNFLSWAGEYEFGGAAVQLFALATQELAAKVVSEDVRILFLPTLPQDITEQQKEVIGTVDLLVIFVQDAAVWKKFIEEVDPKALIPVGPQAEKLLMEMGAANAQTTEEFSFTAESLPTEQTVFVKLATL